tara:strand:+ start:751 stop:1020 length:270 start_codon:yes stop_codon:yes gene_type:complete
MKLDYSNSLKLRALIRKYEFERDQAMANLQVYFEHSVGVGEHGNIVDEMDRLITILTDAEGKLKTTISYFANITAPEGPLTPEVSKSDD